MYHREVVWMLIEFLFNVCQCFRNVIDPCLITNVSFFFMGTPSFEYPKAHNSGLVPSKYLGKKSTNFSFNMRIDEVKKIYVNGDIIARK
jgi:hypothetical protein